MKSNFQDNSIYFVETEKIKPNPFQPRREFDPAQLDSLSDSIRMYGVLQPLVVTRREVFSDDGGMNTEYELIAGERRLRASKLAGLREVPVIIRSDEQSDREKLEVAIIENLQREDLNPVDRAIAFRQLVDEFKLKHAEVAKKVGKSREYVSNTMRILALPEEMLQAITDKKISEGHARTLLMLTDRPEEQMVLFKEIVLKKLTVRAAEKIARRVAYDKVRKKERTIDPHTVEVEEEMSESLGTRVHIERKAVGGKIEIDFFSEEDLAHILKILKEKELGGDPKKVDETMNNFVTQSGGLAAATSLIFEKEKEQDPEPTTVSDEISKATPFSYSSQVVPEEEKVEAVVSEAEKPEPETVSEEIDKTTPFSYTPQADPEEEKVEPVVSEDEKPKEPEENVVAPEPMVLNTSGETTENIDNVNTEPEVDIDFDESVVEDNSQYAEPAEEEVKQQEEVVDVNKLSDAVIASNLKDDASLSAVDKTFETSVVQEDTDTQQSSEPATMNQTPQPVDEKEYTQGDVSSQPQEQQRSKYLEPIEPEDLPNGMTSPIIQTELSNNNDNAQKSEPDSQEDNHIVHEREDVTYNEPNVVTDFVEAQKEANEVSTPNYGSDEDDLYSVKGM